MRALLILVFPHGPPTVLTPPLRGIGMIELLFHSLKVSKYNAQPIVGTTTGCDNCLFRSVDLCGPHRLVHLDLFTIENLTYLPNLLNPLFLSSL